jgi:nuclear GTP-binding protein
LTLVDFEIRSNSLSLPTLPGRPLSTMGRNKNKDNRSTARRNNGAIGSGSKKRDTGLPAYFKQRKINGLPGKDHASLKARKLESEDMEVDDIHENTSVLENSIITEAEDTFTNEKAARDLSLSGKRDNSAKAFMKDVKNVVENSDVILQVLDARDPLGSRSRQTEVLAMGSGKKVVLILNKVDLIPVANLQGWLRYLRNDFPTLAFKASTQQQRGNLKQGKASLSLQSQTGKTDGSTSLSFGSEAVGAAALLQLLKNYSRTSAKGSNLKQQLTVGVIGPPNVGKSSLINSLLRTRACAVASTPGWTKVVQGVMLEKGIRLLDCPGVVVGGSVQEGSLDGEQSKMDNAWSVLRNTVKVELIEDPITPVQALMSRVEADRLCELYNIEGGFNEGDAYDFLLRVALMRGKLGKGGVPDLEGAARIVLHDWNVGRISYYTKVPAVHPSALASGSKSSIQEGASVDETTAGTSLLTSLGEAFELEALLGQADAEALGGSNGTESSKKLFEPRERRLMPIAEASYDSAIAVDDDDLKEGNDSHLSNQSSTLGKRTRGARHTIDSDSDSEIEVDKDTIDAASNSDDDTSIPMQTIPSNDISSEYYDRRQRKAETPLSHRKRELLSVFSPIELEGMAQRRSDVRKAAKKKKKRLHRSEAGLVEVWNQGMSIPTDNDSSRAKTRGLFDVPVMKQDHQEEEEEL